MPASSAPACCPSPGGRCAGLRTSVPPRRPSARASFPEASGAPPPRPQQRAVRVARDEVSLSLCRKHRLNYLTGLGAGPRWCGAETEPRPEAGAPGVARRPGLKPLPASAAQLPTLARPAQARLRFFEGHAPLSGKSPSGALHRKRKCGFLSVRNAVLLGGPEV